PTALGVLDLADHGTVADGLTRGDLQPGHHTGLVRAQRLLHLHRLDDHHRVTLGHRGPFLDGQCDHGALHRADQSITTDCGCAATALAGRTLLLAAPASGRRCGGHTQRCGPDDLGPFAADLHGDALTRSEERRVGKEWRW